MESVILGPHNFLLFITLFTISLGLAVYTFLSYERTPLVYLNLGMFLVCAIRACTEFGMHLTDSYEIVTVINKWNSVIAQLFYVFTWYLLYFYIRPFQASKYSKQLDWIVSIGILGIPNLIIFYCFVTFQCSEFSTEKIAGYWMYRFSDSPCSSFYKVMSFIVLIGLYTSFLMIYSIVKSPEDRVKKTSLLTAFYLITFGVLNKVTSYSVGTWSVTNHIIPMLLDGIIITWFVSGYRLLKDQFEEASFDILNSISDLSFQTNSDLRIELANNRANEYFQKIDGPVTTFLSSHVRHLKHEIKEVINDLIIDSNKNHEITLMTQSGQERIFQMKVSKRRWRGRIAGYTFLLSDITDIKEKETELAELNSTKDQLFSILGHDLRKPALAFRGITNKINYLINKKDFASLNRLGDSIEKSALQLNTLIDNLLKWALSQKNMIDVKEQPVIIKAISDELIKTFELITSEKGIEINNSGIDPDLIIHSDPDLMMTILRNLVDNAIKYSHEDSRVLLVSEQNGDHVHIRVSDQGVGMTKDQLDRLFKLEKEKSTFGTHGERGSGLGLNLVNELVEKTGGELECTSAPNQGTEIKLTYAV